MIAVTLLLCALLYDGELSRFDGIVLLVGALGYTVFAYLSARSDRDPAVAAEFDEGMRELARPAWLDAAFVVAGFGMLLVGAQLLLGGATVVAEGLGIS